MVAVRGKRVVHPVVVRRHERLAVGSIVLPPVLGDHAGREHRFRLDQLALLERAVRSVKLVEREVSPWVQVASRAVGEHSLHHPRCPIGVSVELAVNDIIRRLLLRAHGAVAQLRVAGVRLR